MRIENWEHRLVEYLEQEARETFEWGVRDCVLFVSDICKLLTGIDPASAARGLYSTKDEALELLRINGLTQVGVIDAHFNRIKASFAQRGDIIYRRFESGPALGVIYNGMAIYRSEGKGFIFDKISEVNLAWRIE